WTFRFQRSTTQPDPNSSIATDKLPISTRRLAGESRMEGEKKKGTLPTASFPTPDNDGILRACGRGAGNASRAVPPSKSMPLNSRAFSEPPGNPVVTVNYIRPYAVCTCLSGLQALPRPDKIVRYPIAGPGFWEEKK
ncbi:hypothetical protein CP532_5733, partial [Ophiocordyceps camponoti-leonardi (nom. inval.)]